MRLMKLRYIMLASLFLILGAGIWRLSEKLILVGGSTESKVDEMSVEDDELYTLGKTEQTGTYSEKAVQCVYDFFFSYIPESNIFESSYEVKDLGDNNFCVHVGDWFIFVKGEYDVCYPVKFYKTTPLTEYETKFLRNNGIDVMVNEGVSSWEI